MVSVYADVLVCLNVLITYIFIVCVRVAVNMPSNKWGVCIGSVIGGLSSLVIFAGEVGIIFSVSFKFLTAVIIVFVSFIPESVRQFIKSLVCFFGVSMLFGGVMYFVEITFNPEGIMYLNGTVYFDMDIKYLVGCTFVIYGVFLGADVFLQRRASKNEIHNVTITFRGVAVNLLGYVDTGNNLTDGLTGRKVFVGELKGLSPLFNYEEIFFLKNGSYDRIPDSLRGKVRLVPCKTVGDNTLLPAFTPDKAEIQLNGRKVKLKGFSVAIVNNDLGNGEYNILLHKAIYDF